MAVYSPSSDVIDAIDRRGANYEAGRAGANTSQLGSFLEGLTSGATSAANIGASIVNTHAQYAQTQALYNPERLAQEQLERELKNRRLETAASLGEKYGEQETQAGIAATTAAAELNSASAAGLRQKQEVYGQIGLQDAQADIEYKKAQAAYLRGGGGAGPGSLNAREKADQAAEIARRNAEFSNGGITGVPSLPPRPAPISPEQQELQDAGTQYQDVASQYQHAQQKGQILTETNKTNVQAKAQKFANELEQKGIGLTDVIAMSGADMLQAAGDKDLDTQAPNYTNGFENLLMLDQARQLSTTEEQKSLASAAITQGLKAFPSTDAFIDAIEANPDKTPEQKDADKRAFYKAVYAGDKTNLPKQQKSLADAGFAPENVADTPQTYDRIGLGIANKWDDFDDPDLKRVIRTDPYVAAASTASKNGQQAFTAKMEQVQNSNPGDIVSGNGPSYQMVFRGGDGASASAPLPTTPEGHAMLSVLDVVSKKQKQLLASNNSATQQYGAIEERNQQLVPQPAQSSAAANPDPSTSPLPSPTPIPQLQGADVVQTPQEAQEADVIPQSAAIPGQQQGIASGYGAPVGASSSTPQTTVSNDQAANTFIDNRKFPEIAISSSIPNQTAQIDNRARQINKDMSPYDPEATLNARKQALVEIKETNDKRKATVDALKPIENKEQEELDAAKNYNDKVQNALNIVKANKLEGVFGTAGAAERAQLDIARYSPIQTDRVKAYGNAADAFKNIAQSEIQKAAQVSGPRSVDSPIEAKNMKRLAPSIAGTYEYAVLLDAMNQNKASWLQNRLDISSILTSERSATSGDPLDLGTIARAKREYMNDPNSAKFIIDPKDGISVVDNPNFQDAEAWLKAHTTYEGAKKTPPASSGGTPPASGGTFRASPTSAVTPQPTSEDQQSAGVFTSSSGGSSPSSGGAPSSATPSSTDYTDDPDFRKQVDAYKAFKTGDNPELMGDNPIASAVQFTKNVGAGAIPGFIRRPLREGVDAATNAIQDVISDTSPRYKAVRAQAQKELNEEQDSSWGRWVGEGAQMAGLAVSGELAIGALAKSSGVVGKVFSIPEAVLKATRVPKVIEGVEVTSGGSSWPIRAAARIARGATLDNAAITLVQEGEAKPGEHDPWHRLLVENPIVGAVGAAVVGPIVGYASTKAGDVSNAVKIMWGNREATMKWMADKLTDRGFNAPEFLNKLKTSPSQAIGSLQGEAREIVEDLVNNPKSQAYLNSKVEGSDATVKEVLGERSRQTGQAASDRAGVTKAPSMNETNAAFRSEIEGRKTAIDTTVAAENVTNQTAAQTAADIEFQKTNAAKQTLKQEELQQSLAKARDAFEQAANTDLQGAINDFGKAVGVSVEDLPTVKKPLGLSATSTPEEVGAVVDNYKAVAEAVQETKRAIYQKSKDLIDPTVAAEEGPQIMENLIKSLREDPGGNPEVADKMVKHLLETADNATLGETLAAQRRETAAARRDPNMARTKAEAVPDSELPANVAFLNEMRQMALKGLKSENATFGPNLRNVELIDAAANKLTKGKWKGFTQTYKPLIEKTEKINDAADYIDQIRVAMQEPGGVSKLYSKVGVEDAAKQQDLEAVVGKERKGTVIKAVKEASSAQDYLEKLRKETSKAVPDQATVAEYGRALENAIKLSNNDRLHLGNTVLSSTTTDAIDSLAAGIGPKGKQIIRNAALRAAGDRLKAFESKPAVPPKVGQSAAANLGFKDAEVAALKHALGGDKKASELVDRLFNEQMNEQGFRAFMEGYTSPASTKARASSFRHVIYSGPKWVLDVLTSAGAGLYENKAAGEAVKLLLNPDPTMSRANLADLARRLSKSEMMKDYTIKQIKDNLIEGIARNAFYINKEMDYERGREATARRVAAENAKQVLDNLKADKEALE